MRMYLQDGTAYFQSNKGNMSLPYSIPSYNEEVIDSDNLIVDYFYSPYLTAANDYYSIKIKLSKDQKSFWGMIFPITLLDTVNAEIYEDMNKFHYSMLKLGLNSLIEKFLNSDYYQDNVEYKSLNDLRLSENLFILVADKSEYSNIKMILPSMYISGFEHISDPFISKNLEGNMFISNYLRGIIVNNTHENHILELTPVSSSMNDYQFLYVLYSEIKPLNIPHAFRFLLDYQAIEYLMEYKKNEVLINNLKNFNEVKRGDLREALQPAFKEETLIKKIYEGISTNNIYHNDFIDEAKKIFDLVDKERPKEDGYCSYMYGIRNIIVHNYKEAREMGETLDNISEIFEITIFELMKNVVIDKCTDKKIFIMDKSEKYKDNVRRLSAMYHKAE